MKAIRLRTAGMDCPLGLDITSPRLTWNCEGEGKQKAYQVICKTADQIIYDTGKVESTSMHCQYQGTELTSRQHVGWQVILWDEQEKETKSQESWWEMGLMKEEDWKAHWITGVDNDKQERLPADYYCKQLSLPTEITKARLYVTALGVYTARINGEVVSAVLAPGTTDYDKRLYYQTYDVTNQLQQKAEHTLELTVGDGWYKGKLGANQKEYFFGNQTMVLAQLEVTDAQGQVHVIGTDDSFDYCNDGPIRFSDLKDGEIYDANMTPSYSMKAKLAQETRIPQASNAPLIGEHEEFQGQFLVSPSGAKILDFGQNIAGYIRFTTQAPKESKIRIRMFEALDHGEYSDISLSFTQGNVEPVKQEICYIASGKKETFQPEFFYSGFQYAFIEGLDQVAPEDFVAVAVYSNLEYTGTFSCSNPMLNQFVSNTVWSMKGNFVDIPTDCPQREKGGWTGDAQVFCKTATYLADTQAFYRKWLKDVQDEQHKNGLVEDVNPRVEHPGAPNSVPGGSTGWADAAVIIPYTLWKETGDNGVILENQELMLGWMNYIMELCQDKSMFSLPEDNPLKGIYAACTLPESPWNAYIPESGFHWGEWCVPESQEPPEFDSFFQLLRPKQELTCAYVHYSMTLLKEMLVAIGNEKLANQCEEYIHGSWMAYHTHWVQDDTIHTGHMAELVRPLALGLLDEKQQANVARALNEMVISRDYKVGTGFLSTPFVLQVLAENGYLDTAYRMLENTQAPGWLAMVAQGATSVWEDYECYDQNHTPLPHSFNHYSPGAVCGFLFDTVCGIQVVGENQLKLTPQPGGTLNNATASVMTAYGPVTSSWEKLENRICYTFQIPANVSATITLPDGTTRDIENAGVYTMEQEIRN